MRQLIQEGWIHHICRNSVAIFLTRGSLFKSWQSGLKVFLHYLVDVSIDVCEIILKKYIFHYLRKFVKTDLKI